MTINNYYKEPKKYENAGYIIDVLSGMASDLDIIPLANLMWKGEDILCFFSGDGLAETWKMEIDVIRRNAGKDLDELDRKLKGLDISSAKFPRFMESIFSGAASAFPDSIDRLQERIHQSWKSQLPGNAFFPVFEKIFREGESSGFRNMLRSQRAEAMKSLAGLHEAANRISSERPGPDLSEECRLLYPEYVSRATGALDKTIESIISFYEKKWSLFLSPKQS